LSKDASMIQFHEGYGQFSFKTCKPKCGKCRISHNVEESFQKLLDRIHGGLLPKFNQFVHVHNNSCNYTRSQNKNISVYTVSDVERCLVPLSLRLSTRRRDTLTPFSGRHHVIP